MKSLKIVGLSIYFWTLSGDSVLAYRSLGRTMVQIEELAAYNHSCVVLSPS